jgi:hypothetical protein
MNKEICELWQDEKFLDIFRHLLFSLTIWDMSTPTFVIFASQVKLI